MVKAIQKEIFTCSDCGEEFEDYDDCDIHTRDCRGVPPINDEKIWFCGGCDKRFDTEDEANKCGTEEED